MGSNNDVKRITVKLKSPNPLFEKWLTEWRDKAKDNESKMQYTFNIALKSLKKYPLPFERGKDCIILKGFGSKLCDMLDNKLKEHNSKRQNTDTTIDYEYTAPTSPKKPKTQKQSKKLYTPAYRSGAYAILLTILKKSQSADYPGFMMKQDIIDHARDLCDKSFSKPDPGSYYTAWSSMSTLISKKLIEKKGNPAKYELTPEGFEVALRLVENNENDQNNKNNTESNSVQKSPNNSKKNDEVKELEKINTESEGFESLNTYECEWKSNSDSYKTEIIPSVSNEIIPSVINPSDEVIPSTSTQIIPTFPSNSQSSSGISSTKTSQTKSSSQSSNFETFIFAPNTFDIILLVDTAETEGLNTNPIDDDTKYELNKLGILYEVRHMKVGDFTWIAREQTTENELVLPYVVERKRMDDLGKSIKDGRYHEQKKRLKQSGIQNLMYIVESHGDNRHTGLPLSSLMQAATNTLVQDGFQVKFTDNHRHTMEYLSGFTILLNKYYKNKTLMSTSKEDIQKHCITDDLISLLTFKEFNKGGSKHKDFTVRDLFIKQIVQLKGVSAEKALAITEKYPTPRLLKDEYNKLGKKEGENLLAKIQYGPLKRSIGTVISQSIYQLYTMKQLP